MTRPSEQRPVAMSAGEQPGTGALVAPVVAELRETPLRQRHVAVLAALALVDAQAHPLGIDVRDLQMADLADPEPGSVSPHQHGEVLDVPGDGEQLDQLVMAEDIRQYRRRLGAGHVEVRVGSAERDAVEKADPVPGAVAALPGQSASLVRMEQVVLNLRCGDPLGTAPVEAREPGNGIEIRAYRVLREAANGHVVDHAFAQTCHVSSPLKLHQSRRTPAAMRNGASETGWQDILERREPSKCRRRPSSSDQTVRKGNVSRVGDPPAAERGSVLHRLSRARDRRCCPCSGRPPPCPECRTRAG